MAHSLKESSSRFSKMSYHARVLIDLVSPSTGLCLMDIWSALRAERRPDLSDADLYQLDAIACNLKQSANAYGRP
jgi:hypothetical protein